MYIENLSRCFFFFFALSPPLIEIILTAEILWETLKQGTCKAKKPLTVFISGGRSQSATGSKAAGCWTEEVGLLMFNYLGSVLCLVILYFLCAHVRYKLLPTGVCLYCFIRWISWLEILTLLIILYLLLKAIFGRFALVNFVKILILKCESTVI